MQDETSPEAVESKVPKKNPRILPFRIITRLEGTGIKISEERTRKPSIQ